MDQQQVSGGTVGRAVTAARVGRRAPWPHANDGVPRGPARRLGQPDACAERCRMVAGLVVCALLLAAATMLLSASRDAFHAVVASFDRPAEISPGP